MARRPNLLVYALLAASLAVNLGGAGYLAATWGRKPPRTVESTIDFVIARYPDAVSGPLRAQLDARRGDLARALTEMKVARQATREAMSADPLDPLRIAAAFAESRAKATAFQKVIHDAIAGAIPAVAAPDRARIVDRAGDGG